MLSELEACVPSTEPEWRSLDALFRKLKLRVWVQIMVERFLQKEPENLAAQCARFDLVAETARIARPPDQRHQRLMDAALRLAHHRSIDADGLVRVANALAANTERAHAATMFKRALRLDRTHAPAWNGLVTVLAGMNKNRGAAAALRDMQKSIIPSVSNYVLVADCARWMNDVKTMRSACAQALQIKQASDAAAWVRLTQFLDQINATELLPQALAQIDVISLHRPWMLKALAEVGRIRGFTEIVRTAEARLLAIEG